MNRSICFIPIKKEFDFMRLGSTAVTVALAKVTMRPRSFAAFVLLRRLKSEGGLFISPYTSFDFITEKKHLII